ncbi:glycosyltransferase family 4 protein [Candidatus Woesearchaeota archaeon]|nr:glycosyltransferase family 4 protein [Candidatus Woesearchaeota archaeon]
MKVLMFGWEFPPFNKGGLGVACYGITKGLSNKGVKTTFVIPKAPEDAHADHVKLVVASNIKNVSIKEIHSPMAAYMTNVEYQERIRHLLLHGNEKSKDEIYGQDLFQEVERYALRARKIAENEDFDVIHAHDWMTYKAGIAAKNATGKPLVVHIHATEFDRTGGNGVNQYVYDIEKSGFDNADVICAVSNFTKNKIVEHYGVDPNKVHVVHNAVEFTNFNENAQKISGNEKIVLFLGRITLQKGPDYFVEAARKVADKVKNVKFVIAGSGDMMPKMIEMAAEKGLANKMLFAGFLRGEDIDRAYKMADLYVMPSVSEPFGITPLEAMRNGTPVLISKQSGVSEVVNHCLKVDFWDIDEMANKMIAVLNHSPLKECLAEHGGQEVLKFSWDVPAQKCIDAYKSAIEKRGGK